MPKGAATTTDLARAAAVVLKREPKSAKKASARDRQIETLRQELKGIGRRLDTLERARCQVPDGFIVTEASTHELKRGDRVFIDPTLMCSPKPSNRSFLDRFLDKWVRG